MILKATGSEENSGKESIKGEEDHGLKFGKLQHLKGWEKKKNQEKREEEGAAGKRAGKSRKLRVRMPEKRRGESNQ